MSPHISPLAYVDPRAEIAEDVKIGPFCYVGPDVRIGAGTELQQHVTIEGHTTIGCRNRFFANAVIGTEPQDLSYGGDPTRVEIGDDNVFREGVTVHRGAVKEDGVTRIGNNNFLMANSHVAHNCHVHNRVILVNGTLLGGHVHVFNGAIISGNSVVHHFARVGTLAFLGGGSRLVTDLPPYMLACGNDKLEVVTVNIVGLKRAGVPHDTVQLLKRLHRHMFREFKPISLIRELFDAEVPQPWPTEVHNLLDFMEEQYEGQKGRGREVARKKAA